MFATITSDFDLTKIPVVVLCIRRSGWGNPIVSGRVASSNRLVFLPRISEYWGFLKVINGVTSFSMRSMIFFLNLVRPVYNISLDIVLAFWGKMRKSFGFVFKEALKPETAYKVTLSGRGIVPFSWGFETKSVMGDGVGSSAAADAWKAYEERNPLVGYMPVVTSDFKHCLHLIWDIEREKYYM